MLESTRGRRQSGGGNVLTGHRAATMRELIECGFCGAPNGGHREGCFNCGALLGPEEREEQYSATGMKRVAVGEEDHPGRVVYLRQ